MLLWFWQKLRNSRSRDRDIINFCVGEPDFDTPSNIKKAGIKAIEDNKTHYSPPAGIPDFRRDSCKIYKSNKEY